VLGRRGEKMSARRPMCPGRSRLEAGYMFDRGDWRPLDPNRAHTCRLERVKIVTVDLASDGWE
jgi:hypothetical protein